MKERQKQQIWGNAALFQQALDCVAGDGDDDLGGHLHPEGVLVVDADHLAVDAAREHDAGADFQLRVYLTQLPALAAHVLG